jgi:hypothetical protein
VVPAEAAAGTANAAMPASAAAARMIFLMMGYFLS